MEHKDTDNVLTPEEIKAQKKREYQREYRRSHLEQARARCKAWRENNPEKNKESQKKASRKYYWAHQAEMQALGREVARKYYAEHREEVLARQKVYQSNNREKIAERRRGAARTKSEAAKQREYEYKKQWCKKNPEKLREYARKYACEHRAELAAKRKTNAANISIRRKEKYQQNPQPARARAAAYWARAKASRQMAPDVCPAFRFVMDLKATNSVAYKMCGGAKYSFVQRAVKGCPALSASDASLCPMVANPKIQKKKMLALCTMPDVFMLPFGLPEIRAHAVALGGQRER